MRQVNIHEAKTHLSRLADEAGAGETIILAKAGKPVAKLVPLTETNANLTESNLEEPRKPKRDMSRFGFLKGRLRIPDDFDTMHQEEIISMFEGRE
jgi:prevent-host-death family protein